MPKFDISKNTQGHDTALAKLTDPRHRRIVENYRRHAVLEVSGLYEQIFEPDMTIETPVYKIIWGGAKGEDIVGDEVRAMYRLMTETGKNVIVVSNEKIAAHDDGMFSTADMTEFYRGHEVLELGYEIDNADGWYALTWYTVQWWPYDDQLRLIGETGAALGDPKIEEIDEKDVITPEQARAALAPLLQPLTPLEEPATV
ncbi:hypothetical protein OPAG_06866 [Rhodococcus opacus PD630]|uniref:hypothetical protein n=2 Tax=Rhodococcus opacus TaxID=37919 RepID=UPI00029CBA1A|nr:hypothetical protein [Rhodococcus opacus]AHK36069.1 hypothetical protein Pd630_LPD16110 [Rhodococcus opacus PD630]EHI43583.1 hypothetical protein OPAG_06866 [Rhodococcus opacus PD630]UDH01284.1 hypothetical protein K2Z90_007755 [Rhodococcus opacus PD630]